MLAMFGRTLHDACVLNDKGIICNFLKSFYTFDNLKGELFNKYSPNKNIGVY